MLDIFRKAYVDLTNLTATILYSYGDILWGQHDKVGNKQIFSMDNLTINFGEIADVILRATLSCPQRIFSCLYATCVWIATKNDVTLYHTLIFSLINMSGTHLQV